MNDLQFLQQHYQAPANDFSPPCEDSERDFLSPLVIQSSSMVLTSTQLLSTANLPGPVLICGPPGSGKKLAALALHKCSVNKAGPFQILRCGQLSSHRLLADITDRWHLVSQGTLVLDQFNLVKIEQREEIISFFNTQLDSLARASVEIIPRPILISSTPLALSLRPPLQTVLIPPLSKRQKDLAGLVQQMLRRLGKIIHFSSEAWQCFEEYSWPGNVGELANLVERLSLLHPEKQILPLDLPGGMVRTTNTKNIIPDEGIDFNRKIEELEQDLILAALEKTNGNKNQAAKLLRINRTTLIEKMKKKQISLSSGHD